jgi:steroid delta-isomerase-like uncharacterized protein
MSIETNKAQMERFVTFINSNDPALAEKLVAADAAFHVPFQEEPLVGPAAYVAVVNMMRGGFSDIQWELLELVAEGDTVAARFQTRGTHDGTFFGFPATGRKIVGRAMNFYRFTDGKIVGEVGLPDLLGLLQQIDAVPQLDAGLGKD